MKLVIVESPTKAKTISKFLGSDYKVVSSFGHVMDLPKSNMGIDIENGTFEPHYIVSRDKTKKVKELKDDAKKAKEIYFATDEDREGEAISWHLAELFKTKEKDVQRLVFHEITKHALEEALKHPRPLDMHLVDAQQARRVLDRLVGYELSPLLWKKVARGLSAGRVQSVTVRLIVEREREIKAFVPQEYWTLDGLFTPDKKQIFEARLEQIKGKKLGKFDLATQQHTDDVVKDLKNATYAVKTLEAKKAASKPSAPYRTSTLQQEANHRLGMSSKQTMRVAQQLYEGIDLGPEGHTGLITYMRTDSVNLSDKFIQEARAHIKEAFGAPYLPEQPRIFKSTAKGAQEAHEAIRPSDPARAPELIIKYLDAQQYKLYDLIWRRAVATQMSDAELQKTTVDIEAKNYIFRANGQMVTFDGYLKLYPTKMKDTELPALKEGQALTCTQLKPEQHYTEPPARYSDATLVKALEEYGIGRPSTYAPTISTVEDRGYVIRDEQKRLAPTDIAGVVTDLLAEHFPTIVDYQFTARMEQDLDEIAEGNKEWKPMIKEFYGPFHETIEQKTEELKRSDVLNAREIGIDPVSGKPISARVGRFGPFVQIGTKDDKEKPKFASLKKNQHIETITLEEALQLLTLPKTLGTDSDGNDIVVSIGRFGPYVKVGSNYYSIKQDDPYTLALPRALEIIKEKKEAEANKIIHDFKNAGIQVLNGRYGPYITDGKKNAKIPKDKEPKDLTEEECVQLLKDAPEKKRHFTRKQKTTA